MGIFSAVERRMDQSIELRAALEAGHEIASELADAMLRIAELEAENAELRGLVRDMYACISHANEQDWFYFERDKFGCGMSCTVNGEVCGLCVLADRMAELGIGVG